MSVTDQVKSLTHQLRLAGFHEHVQRRIDEALSAQLHPAEFLRLLLEDEVLARRNIRAKILTAKAKFRNQVDLEDWDMTEDRGISKQQLKELSHLGFIKDQQNLIFLGSTGCGKTHLSMALGRRACVENFSVAFIPVNFLFDEAMAEKAAGKYVLYIKKIAKNNMIILDDFGLRNYTHQEAMILVDLMEERYGKSSIVITSQVDPQGWSKLFEDPVIADAITDRMKNPSKKINLKGPSYREKLKKMGAGK